VRVAQLLMAVRQALMPGAQDVGRLRHANTIARITAAIFGDSKDFAKVLPEFPSKTVKQQPVPARLRTRLRPWQCSTPSWPAAYNLACAYAALAARADEGPQLETRLPSRRLADLGRQPGLVVYPGSDQMHRRA
jgi:hypothetical protein